MREQEIIDIIIRRYPDVQAVYLFGSYGTEYERADSDVDIALLLPVKTAKQEKLLSLSPCSRALEDLIGKTVDLINLHHVSTVFQCEIINSGRLIYSRGDFEVATFEMITMSLYQKLNAERADILIDFFKTRRAYNV